MTTPAPDYNSTLQRATDVFGAKPFVFSQLRIESKLRSADLIAALEALVADGMLTVISERPTVYQVAKFA